MDVAQLGTSAPAQGCSCATQQSTAVESALQVLDLPGDCTWAEVMSSMEEATQNYKAKAENDRIRAMQRNRAVAATLHCLAEMIPEQDGLSVLRGALKGIFTLLKKRIDNGERILSAFEDIPITFSEACHALVARPNDERLRNFVWDLFATVKEEISKLTEILLRKHKVSLPKKILRQHPENEAASIDRSLELIGRASRRVSVRVSTLANETMIETLRETMNVGQETSRTQSAISELRERLDSVQRSQLEMERNSSARYERQESLAHTFFTSINQNLQHSLSGCESQFRLGFSGMQESLQELMWHAQPTLQSALGNIPTQSPYGHCGLDCPPATSMPISVSMSYDELYMILRLPDPLFLVNDLGLVLRASNAIGHNGLSRGAWLLNMDRFKVWAQIPNGSSDFVLVDGHLGEYCRGKISPLSVLSAIFASMNKHSHFMILTHFCGLHTSMADPMSGCRGMLRGLIAQLIINRRNDYRSTRVCLGDELLQAITQHDLEALCQLFQALLSEIHPDTTIYCVIDDVSQFETTLGGWGEELYHVVHMMQTLSRQRRWGPVFKVLLTTAHRSIQVYRQIDTGDVISLSAGNRSSMPMQRLSIEGGWSGALGST
ncbi:hypothetical protein ACJZ2D_014929 [Fusarium nematophilum]